MAKKTKTKKIAARGRKTKAKPSAKAKSKSPAKSKPSAKKPVAKRPKRAPGAGYDAVLDGMVDLLETARRAAARSVNAIMTATYWEIGRRVVEQEQHGKARAG